MDAHELLRKVHARAREAIRVMDEILDADADEVLSANIIDDGGEGMTKADLLKQEIEQLRRKAKQLEKLRDAKRTLHENARHAWDTFEREFTVVEMRAYHYASFRFGREDEGAALRAEWAKRDQAKAEKEQARADYLYAHHDFIDCCHAISRKRVELRRTETEAARIRELLGLEVAA